MDPLKVPPPTDTKLHFLDYWRIIRIRKTVILAVFVLVVLTATLVTFILPPRFASTAKIRVDRDVSDITGLTERQSLAGYDPYFSARYLDDRHLTFEYTPVARPHHFIFRRQIDPQL